MHSGLQASPELMAVDLIRVHMEGMGIAELSEHVEDLRSVLVGLIESRHLRPHISPTAAQDERSKRELPTLSG